MVNKYDREWHIGLKNDADWNRVVRDQVNARESGSGSVEAQLPSVCLFSLDKNEDTQT